MYYSSQGAEGSHYPSANTNHLVSFTVSVMHTDLCIWTCQNHWKIHLGLEQTRTKMMGGGGRDLMEQLFCLMVSCHDWKRAMVIMDQAIAIRHDGRTTKMLSFWSLHALFLDFLWVPFEPFCLMLAVMIGRERWSSWIRPLQFVMMAEPPKC